MAKTIKGSAKADKLTVNESNIILNAGKGNDTITVTKGSKGTIRGEAGNDTIIVKKTVGTKNKIYGDAGIDTIKVQGSSNNIYGGAGNDIISLSSGTKNVIHGNAGNDKITITGGSGNTLYGDAGNDKFIIKGGSNTFYGGAGSDTYQIGASKKEITAVISDPYRKGDTDTIEFADKNLLFDGSYYYGDLYNYDGDLTIAAEKNTNGSVNMTAVKVTIQDFSNSNIETITFNNETGHLITQNIKTYVNNKNIVDRYIIAGTNWDATIASSTGTHPDKLDLRALNDSGYDMVLQGVVKGKNLVINHYYSDNFGLWGEMAEGYKLVAGGTLTLSNFSAGKFVAIDDDFVAPDHVDILKNITAGTTGADKMAISSSDQYYFAAQGDDTITLTGSYNRISGDAGNDTIVIGTSSKSANYNYIVGGSGIDTITVKKGNFNVIYAGSGNDIITISAGDFADVHGDAGNDTITIGKNLTNSHVSGDAGDDTFIINGGKNGGTIGAIYGGSGNDTFICSSR